MSGSTSAAATMSFPCRQKGGKDQIGIVQTTQDIRFVEEKFPGMRCRAISVQFMAAQIVALFELTLQDDEIKVVEERHYRLVPAEKLDQDAIRAYRDRNFEEFFG